MYYLKKTVHFTVDFYKAMRRECPKIGFNPTLNFVAFKYMAHKLCRPSFTELNPKPTNFGYLIDEHSHIEYIYYLKKRCMFPVRFMDFYKMMRRECLIIGLNHTEFCGRQVHGS